ncbi:MAG TPA: patatin-like phospholipase family protein [Acidimicrobiales bacterium]|nr:patatin-like phospholipase family protein [Acidimicrobiales bacterium]
MTILRPSGPWRRAPRTIFVLGGGGNLGALQVGMLQAVLERGIVPDELVGCSAGALNAAMLAADPTADGLDRLRTLWLTGQEDIVAPFSRFDGVRLLTHRGVALQSNDGLRRLLETHLPHRRFEDFPIPFHVVATSLTTNSERWFSKGDVIEPILASAALPAIFPPVVIDGDVLVDGGVLNNVPISKAHELSPNRIYVFHVGNFERPRLAPKKPIDVLLQAFSISRSYRFETEVRQVPAPGVEVVVVPSVDPGKLRYNDFSRSAELIERGRAATATYLDTRVEAVHS